MAAWNAMRPGLPPDSPWLTAIDQVLAEADRRMAAADTPPAESGPGADDIAAASQMSPEDRNAMIETMVARLDEKLKQNPRIRKAGSGWFVPMSCSARPTRRATRWRRGVAALGADSEQAAELQAFAAALGLTRAE